MGNRKTLIGVVVSTANSKTINVKVNRVDKHPLYNKSFTVSKKYQAHDESEVANVGDTVKIVETRPLSATKRFELLEVIKTATFEVK